MIKDNSTAVLEPSEIKVYQPKKLKFYQKNKFKDNLWGYIFILPNLIGFLVFSLGGLLFSIYMSFTDWNLLAGVEKAKFIGLENYIKMFTTDAWFRVAMLNSFLLLLIIPIQVILAMVLAAVLNKGIFGRAPVRALFFAPYVTSSVAIAAVWRTLFHPTQGPINVLLIALGLENPPLWLSDLYWALPAYAIIVIWQSLGYHILLYIAGIQNIPSDLYEAAEVDGASKVGQFFRITLPLLSPTTFLIVILSIIGSMQSWSLIQILTRGGPGKATYTLAYYIYDASFKLYKSGYGAALSMILMIIILIITLVQWQGQNKWVNY